MGWRRVRRGVEWGSEKFFGTTATTSRSFAQILGVAKQCAGKTGSGTTNWMISLSELGSDNGVLMAYFKVTKQTACDAK